MVRTASIVFIGLIILYVGILVSRLFWLPNIQKRFFPEDIELLNSVRPFLSDEHISVYSDSILYESLRFYNQKPINLTPQLIRDVRCFGYNYKIEENAVCGLSDDSKSVVWIMREEGSRQIVDGFSIRVEDAQACFFSTGSRIDRLKGGGVLIFFESSSDYRLQAQCILEISKWN